MCAHPRRPTHRAFLVSRSGRKGRHDNIEASPAQHMRATRRRNGLTVIHWSHPRLTKGSTRTHVFSAHGTGRVLRHKSPFQPPTNTPFSRIVLLTRGPQDALWPFRSVVWCSVLSFPPGGPHHIALPLSIIAGCGAVHLAVFMKWRHGSDDAAQNRI